MALLKYCSDDAGVVELLNLRGRQTERRKFEIAPERDLDLGLIALAAAPGRVTVTSSPAGAGVSVNGKQRGTTPLELALPSGREHDLPTPFRAECGARKIIGRRWHLSH